jgi:hypothetical protein
LDGVFAAMQVTAGYENLFNAEVERENASKPTTEKKSLNEIWNYNMSGNREIC